MKLSDFKIGTRLGASFGIIAVMMVILSISSLGMMSLINDNIDDIVLHNNAKVALGNTLSQQVHVVSRLMHNAVMTDDAEARKREIDQIRVARAAYDRARAELEKLPVNEEGRTLHAKIDAGLQLARSLNGQVIALSQENKTEEARALLREKAGPAMDQWQDILQEEIRLQERASRQQYEAAKAQYAVARGVLIAGNVAGIAVAALLGWLMTRSVTRPMAHTQEAIHRLSNGDLTVALQAEGKDETAQLIAALANMKDHLAQTVQQVRQSSESLASSSDQIASDTYAMSQRTEEQASALEQTAASMEELGSTARQNADNIQEASQLALTATQVATQGGDVVNQVISTMKGINEASTRIADIINVIDGIAFQTNILALNAAVEAARAGEQGRGFAVVASEVRTLAQRSAQAAKEIKGLITTSVERVEQGAALVDQAGHTMAEVVVSIKHVTDLMRDINTASVEQSTNVTQVGAAMGQMDMVTQKNAAFVEESAAAAEHLKQQAHELVRAVGVFKLAA
jgi:methyl-accepting chemotaxis protein